MSLIYNGTTISKLVYNGIEINTGTYNGVEVYSIAPKDPVTEEMEFTMLMEYNSIGSVGRTCYYPPTSMTISKALNITDLYVRTNYPYSTWSNQDRVIISTISNPYRYGYCKFYYRSNNIVYTNGAGSELSTITARSAKVFTIKVTYIPK